MELSNSFILTAADRSNRSRKLLCLKPSEHAPHCASLLKKMIGEVFPSHYVAVINGGVEISEKLLEQSFDHIFLYWWRTSWKDRDGKSIETFNTSDFGIRWKKSMHCRRKPILKLAANELFLENF